MYIFSATDVFIHNTPMKKVKLIQLFILSFVLQNKHGRNMRFYTAIIFDLQKSDLVFLQHLILKFQVQE